MQRYVVINFSPDPTAFELPEDVVTQDQIEQYMLGRHSYNVEGLIMGVVTLDDGPSYCSEKYEEVFGALAGLDGVLNGWGFTSIIKHVIATAFKQGCENH